MDTRIAFSAHCTWWGTIYEVAKGAETGKHIPTCPHCGSPLYEDPDRASWDKRMTSISEKYPRYAEIMDWQRDNKVPCSRSWEVLQEKFQDRALH